MGSDTPLCEPLRLWYRDGQPSGDADSGYNRGSANRTALSSVALNECYLFIVLAPGRWGIWRVFSRFLFSAYYHHQW